MQPKIDNPTHYVLGFCFNSDGSLVKLIRKNRPEWQKGRLNGIGGKVEKEDEDKWGPQAPLMAMHREFHEETGVLVKYLYEWNHFATLHGKDWAVFIYRMFNDQYFNECNTTTDEDICEVSYLQLLHLDEKVCISNLFWLIPLARHSENVKLPVIIEYAT